MRTRRSVGVVAGLVAALALTSACSNDSEQQSQGETLKIGVAAPLTGPLAGIGSQMVLAVDYAAKEINDAGGIDGRQVTVVKADTTEDPTRATTEVNRLLTQERVDMLVGPATTDGVTAVLPSLTEANIPVLHGSGSPAFSPDKLPNGISYTASVPDQARAMVDYAKSKGYQKVALLNDNGAYGRSFLDEIKNNLGADGDALANEQYKAGDADFTPQLINLQREAPDVLMVVASNGNDTGTALKGVQQLNWDVPIVGNYGTTFVAAAKAIAGDNAFANVVSVTYPGVGACSAENLDATARDFLTNVSALDAEAAAKAQMDFVAIIRDGVRLLAEAADSTKSLDGTVVVKWLETNASSVTAPIINKPVSISASAHFITGAEAMVAVLPNETVAPGIFKKASC